MPLYEYKCDNCGNLFEVMQKFADAPLTSHQECGGRVHRLLSAPALQFKGSGWYVNDYAKGSGSAPNNASKKDESSASSSSSNSDSGSKDSSASNSSKSDSSSKAESSSTKPESKPA